MSDWKQICQEGWRLHLFKLATPPSFDRQRIGNTIAVDRVGSPGRVEELDRRFEEEQHDWDRRVKYLEEEVRRLRCKSEEEERSHEDGSRIDPRGDVFINWFKGVEEGVALIDPYLTSISKGGGVSEYSREGSATGLKIVVLKRSSMIGIGE